MKRSVMIILALLVAVPVFGRLKIFNSMVVRELPKKLPRLKEHVYLNTLDGAHIL